MILVMLLQQHHEEAVAVLCEVHRHASSSGEALRGTRDAPWNGNVPYAQHMTDAAPYPE